MFALKALFLIDVCLGVRQNLKMMGGDGASQVLGKINALMQKHSGGNAKSLARLRALVSTTPGATDSLNEALATVVAHIEENTEPMIKSSFTGTQAAVSAGILKLSDATQEALSQKAGADAKHESWIQCIGEEKTKRVAVEEACQAMAKASQYAQERCAFMESIKRTSSGPTSVPAVQCDFSVPGSCDNAMHSLEAWINEEKKRTREVTDQAESDWTLAKTVCDAANSDWSQKTNVCEREAPSEWSHQKDLCQELHEHRQVKFCIFGTTLQDKCEAVTAHETLLAEVDRVNGGAHSLPDMQSEWTTMQVTKCMLSKIMGGSELDEAALAACDSAVDFDRQVGALERQEEQFADLTSNAKFTCREEAISFGIAHAGLTWNVPLGEAPASDEYTMEQFLPDVSFGIGTLPFGFCDSTFSEAPTVSTICEWSQERNASKCPFSVGMWLSGSLPLADWEAHRVDITIDEERLLGVDERAASKAGESLGALRPLFAVQLDLFATSVNADVSRTRSETVVQLADAMESDVDSTSKVVEATFPAGQVDIATQEKQVRSVDDNSICHKVVAVETMGDTFYLTNWKNMVVARTHDLDQHCESVWSVECDHEEMVETKYCRHQEPSVEKFCLSGFFCWSSTRHINKPNKGTLSVRLPGHESWMLAAPGDGVKISITENSAGRVIDGSHQFAGNLAPQVDDHTVTFSLPGFTEALATETCGSGWSSGACRWATENQLKSVDTNMNITTGNPHLGSWPAKIETHDGAAVMQVVVNMEDVGAAFSHALELQLGGAIPEYKVVDVGTEVNAEGSKVVFKVLTTLSSHVWVE